MRQILLDTETTGLDHKSGHRIIEVAAIEMNQRRLSERHLHYYLNPERAVDAGAFAVHGISDDFLRDKPLFADIAAELRAFLEGAELIIHNASFDIGFLNAEFARLKQAPIEGSCTGVCDTLRMAKELHPGKKNNLNALCERYGVDNTQRSLHGALLDAQLLGEVYLAMTRGQDSLLSQLDQAVSGTEQNNGEANKRRQQNRTGLILAANATELSAHQQVLSAIQKQSKNQCLWLADEAK
ncbi:MAG: DNA polymerase III subunit epsilon [Pseudomonadota bacterium]